MLALAASMDVSYFEGVCAPLSSRKILVLCFLKRRTTIHENLCGIRVTTFLILSRVRKAFTRPRTIFRVLLYFFFGHSTKNLRGDRSKFVPYLAHFYYRHYLLSEIKK